MIAGSTARRGPHNRPVYTGFQNYALSGCATEGCLLVLPRAAVQVLRRSDAKLPDPVDVEVGG